ncbi:RNA polymerase sigma factor [Paludisphaera mucosa]|uniref:RNA polymerase sigma factor n=1 Tax=Paludisphaera mucosa TaxID=3030827 RepID=UPI0034A54D8B
MVSEPAGIGNDEQVAIERILRDEGPKVLRTLRHKFGLAFNVQDYEDILAQSLYLLWKYWDRYEPSKGPLSHWFFGIAQRVAIDLLRATASNRASSLTFIDQPIQKAPVEPRAPNSIEEALHAVLESLSETDRTIILRSASADEQESWAAKLAPELSMSAGAIRVRRIRIQEKIRTAMAERGYMTKVM